MRVLENTIENKVVKYAKEQGCLVRKMNGLGFVGWPDRMFIGPTGRVWFVEFKAEDKSIEKGSPQELFIDELRKRKLHAYECNNVERGKAIIDAECSE